MALDGLKYIENSKELVNGMSYWDWSLTDLAKDVLWSNEWKVSMDEDTWPNFEEMTNIEADFVASMYMGRSAEETAKNIMINLKKIMEAGNVKNITINRANWIAIKSWLNTFIGWLLKKTEYSEWLWAEAPVQVWYTWKWGKLTISLSFKDNNNNRIVEQETFNAFAPEKNK